MQPFAPYLRLVNWVLKLKLFILCCLLANTLAGQALFEENKGQWRSEVLYRCRLQNGALLIEKNSLTWVLYDNSGMQHPNTATDTRSKSSKGLDFSVPAYLPNQKGHAYRVDFVGANTNSVIQPERQVEQYYNYFMGSDQSQWAGHVRAFEALRIKNIYPGIDLELTSSEGQFFKYNFYLNAGVDISQIKLRYSGTDGLSIKQGRLLIKTSINTVTEEPPLAWLTDGSKVNICYKITDSTLSFSSSKNIFDQALTIDPKVVFSSFSGSTSDNFGFTATYDNAGNGYSGGIVFGGSAGAIFPVTLGAFQTSYANGTANGQDIGLLKYSPDGTGVVWVSYLGGSLNEQPHSLVVNSKNELLVFGTTFSTNFPVTTGVIQATNRGESDIFITKISTDGSTITASTYLGGFERDGLNGTLTTSNKNNSPLGWNYGDIYRGEVNVDENDDVYIASCTESDNIPVKGNLHQSFLGKQDGCVFKLNANLSQVIWGYLVGGNEYDACYGIFPAVDGSVYVCGGSNSATLNMANNTGAYQSGNAGGTSDGFILALTKSGSITAASFAGTGGSDQAYLVQADKYGFPYIYGQTTSDNWKVTPPIYSNFKGKQFITKFDKSLSNILRSTVFGAGRATTDISPSAFLVDKCERVFVSGWGGEVNDNPHGHGGRTTNMPLTANAFQSNTDGSDFYLAVFNKNMDDLLYATYFGGTVKKPNGEVMAEHVDGGTSRFDYEGKVYQSVCAGCGGSSAFPTTPGAFSRVNKSTNCNNALFKIDFENLNYKPQSSDGIVEGFATDTIIYTLTAADQDKYDSLYLVRNGNIFGPPTAPDFAIMPETSGIGIVSSTFSWKTGCEHISNDTYYVNIIIHDNNACPKSDTGYATIKILVKEPPLIKPPDVVCVAHVDDKTVKVSWDALDDSRYFSYYLLYRRDPVGKTIVIDTIFKNGKKELFDKNTPNHQIWNYCYFMQGVNICGRFGDTSYKACSADEFQKPIDSSYVYTATVEENKFIRINWKTSTEPDFGSYLLFKSSSGIKNFSALYRSFYNLTDTTFLDSTVNVKDSSYCYTLKVTDKCGHISRYSNMGCTIVLKGESKPYLHDLYWNPYIDWKKGVSRYEIYRADSVDNKFEHIDRIWSPVVYYPDTTMFYDWGIYTYQIVAKEAPGGYAAQSMSNQVQLVQKPLLWVPSAFSPNDDGLNDQWGYMPVFVKDFHLKVFNRWGELVHQTHDKHQQWDGSFRNKVFDNNLYIWVVTYTGFDNSMHSQRGKVLTID